MKTIAALSLLSLAFLPPASGGRSNAPGFTAGNLFVASEGTNSIFEFQPNGVFVREFGPAFGLTAPHGLTFGPNGNLFVTTSAAGGSVFEITIGTTGAPALAQAWGVGNLTNPRDVAFGADGSLYVGTDTGIVEVSTSDAVVRTVANAAVVSNGRFCYGANNALYTANADLTPSLARFDVSGAYAGAYGPAPAAVIVALTGAPDGSVIYADASVPQNVVTLDTTGTPSNTASPANAANALAVGPNAKLFATNAANQVVTLAPSGAATVVVAATAGLSNPRGLTFCPYRFNAKITGTLARTGVANKNPNQQVTVSIGAGSGVVLVEVIDNPKNSSDLTDVFGASAWVFHGFEANTSANNKKEVHGTQTSTNALQGGMGSIVFDVTGKTGGQGMFSVRKGTGTVHRASPLGVLNGRIVTSKWINNQ